MRVIGRKDSTWIRRLASLTDTEDTQGGPIMKVNNITMYRQGIWVLKNFAFRKVQKCSRHPKWLYLHFDVCTILSPLYKGLLNESIIEWECLPSKILESLKTMKNDFKQQGTEFVPGCMCMYSQLFWRQGQWELLSHMHSRVFLLQNSKSHISKPETTNPKVLLFPLFIEHRPFSHTIYSD